MQTIKIPNDLHKQIEKQNIDIPNELQKIVQKYKNSYQLSNEEIKRVVENSQRIEGYEPISKELEVEEFMKRHNFEISA